jgi:hypothetical protein
MESVIGRIAGLGPQQSPLFQVTWILTRVEATEERLDGSGGFDLLAHCPRQ